MGHRDKMAHTITNTQNNTKKTENTNTQKTKYHSWMIKDVKRR